MPENEFGPPQEAMDWHPPTEDAEHPSELDGVVESPHGEGATTTSQGIEHNPSQEPNTAEEPTDNANQDLLAFEGSEEYQETVRAIEKEVRAGIATLHSLLHLDVNMRVGKAPEKEQFNNLVDASGKLAELFPRSRKDLYDALKHEKSFRVADLPTFTHRATEILATWIHMEKLNRTGDQWLNRKDGQNQQQVPQKKEEQPQATPPLGEAEKDQESTGTESSVRDKRSGQEVQ